MTCSNFIEGFSDYVDGVAAPSAMEAARRHLDVCPSCRRYEAVYLRGRSLLRASEPVRVGERFRSRLQHRLFHVDDERALARSRSAPSALALLAGFVTLLAAAAWSPGLFEAEPEVQLTPIVVNRPAYRPLGLRAPFANLLPARTPAAFDLRGADLWSQSSTLLFRYAPIHARYQTGGELVRAGLQ
jgi:anti-sigma factor RsiW